MHLTLEQVNQMAPDSASAAAGKKLMGLRNWPELGRSAAALWGKCQGSAVYQVKVDLANLGYNCSCPSRKFPCKHVLGLLMLAAQSPEALTEQVEPGWVDEWLAKRRAREEAQATPKADKPAKPVDEQAQQKRAEQRGSNIRDGLARLDLWLKDLVRAGLAAVETRPAAFWDEQARRLVDAQAPGLASRVARLAAIPRSSSDWVERLLAELGRLKLVLRAYERLDALDPAFASDLKQLVGINVSQQDLEGQGEKLADTWVVAGQWIDDDDRLRAQRSWVIGRQSGRTGLILQFTPGNQPFAESIVPGTELAGSLVFYPGAARLRAKIVQREATVVAQTERPPGCASCTEFLDEVAGALARHPWLAAYGGVLREVTVVPRADAWLLRDSTGRALPLRAGAWWKELSISAGRPCDVTVEWNGRHLRPLGMFADGQYWTCG